MTPNLLHEWVKTIYTAPNGFKAFLPGATCSYCGLWLTSESVTLAAFESAFTACCPAREPIQPKPIVNVHTFTRVVVARGRVLIGFRRVDPLRHPL